MIASLVAFAGGSALTLGAAYFMLRTMSMLKAGVALMGCALGGALLLFSLHADVVATMAIMMFGPAMLGMILFMLMLMEDSGGFMMTSRSDVPSPPAAASAHDMKGSQAMSSAPRMAHGDHWQMQRGGHSASSPSLVVAEHPGSGEHADKSDSTFDDVEPEVEREAAGMLGPISEISPMTDAMDMAMTNSQMRWAGWLALGFFVANAIVVVATPWTRDGGASSLLQPFLIGTALLEKYMLVFEGCGFLILLSVIVATMVGRKART